MEKDLRLSKCEVEELKSDNGNIKEKPKAKESEALNVMKHLGEEITVEIDKIKNHISKRKRILKMNSKFIKKSKKQDLKLLRKKRIKSWNTW